jgi:hypothetical protein
MVELVAENDIFLGRKYPEEKTLKEGNILRIKSWVSSMYRDANDKGRELNQIQCLLEDKSWINFPPECWRYTKNQIRKLYNSIHSFEYLKKLIELSKSDDQWYKTYKTKLGRER